MSFWKKPNYIGYISSHRTFHKQETLKTETSSVINSDGGIGQGDRWKLLVHVIFFTDSFNDYMVQKFAKSHMILYLGKYGSQQKGIIKYMKTVA